MNHDFLIGFKWGIFFFISFFLLVIGVSAWGGHSPAQILPGIFEGNYSFDSLSFEEDKIIKEDSLEANEVFFNDKFSLGSGLTLSYGGKDIFRVDNSTLQVGNRDFEEDSFVYADDLVSSNIWSHSYTNLDGSGSFILEGPDGERLEEFGGFLIIDDGSRSSLYHISYSTSGSWGPNEYSDWEELESLGSSSGNFWIGFDSSNEHSKIYYEDVDELHVGYFGGLH